MKNKGIAAMILLGLVLAACTGGTSPAATAVEQYLGALVGQQPETLTTLVCSGWESQALLEMDAFGAVAPELQDLDCEETGTEDGTSLVVCAGRIVTTYNNEKSELELSDWTYEVIQQGGNWLVCGYH
ncbi:MAG TPA: hypothetical protein PKG95_03410 [Anaerolineaceae bacterium]|nr:hypothetical protein [Anaerolineaceae bacterium]